MRLLGIDPGLGGAAAVIDDGGNAPRLVDAIDLPVWSPTGTDAQRRIDARAFLGWLERVAPDRGAIELVTAMPSIDGRPGEERRGMGAATLGKFMRAVGAVEACVWGSGIRLDLVMATSWKAHFGLRGSNKELSRRRAVAMFGEVDQLARKKDEGRAEAALIAVWLADRIRAGG